MKWISVKNGIPEDHEIVLIYAGCGAYDLGFHVKKDLAWSLVTDGRINGVTHWMPLPKPPKQC